MFLEDNRLKTNLNRKLNARMVINCTYPSMILFVYEAKVLTFLLHKD